MSSAFNLSTLAAMQEQRVEQVSVHFWRCQLTREQPRFEWRPYRPEHQENQHKNGNGEQESDENQEDADEIEGVTRHLLHVTGCVLAPKTTGIHLVTVRTGQKQQQVQQPAGDEEKEVPNGADKLTMTGTPILCIDPASQRTLALGHEFVLETGSDEAGSLHQTGPATPSSCTFELAEGDGPVWLTGTHRVRRVVPLVGAGDDEEDEEEEADEEEVENEEADEEEEEDIDEEEMEADEEDDDEEDEEEEEEVKTKKKPAASKSKPASKKPAAKPTKKQQQAAEAQQRRKRAKPDS